LDVLVSHPEAFNGLMCFSPEVAADLATHDFDNLLIAYPYVGELQLIRLFQEWKGRRTLGKVQ
jgi:D-serine deaminase-like pyridoxal phosphate-dependent protein